MNMALQGIRILDLTRMLPGPYATMILADLGAEVIKIEDVDKGDPLRGGDGDPLDSRALFAMLNRNKQSLAVNLKHPEGAGVFRALAKTADVVLEGFRPGVMDRLGIGYEALKAIQPGIVFCSLSGFGQDGPMRNRPAHDINYEALAGILGLQTDATGRPVMPPIQIADLGAALFAVIGVLSALRARERTREGQAVDVSMMDAGLALNVTAASLAAGGCEIPLRARLPLAGGLAYYNVYETADGRHLSVGAVEALFWKRFCSAIGHDEFASLQHDPSSQTTMIRAVEAAIRARTLAEWMEVFGQMDACVTPVLALSEVLDDPQTRHRQMVLEPQLKGGFRQLNLPFKLSATPSMPERTAAPRLGQHSRMVLSSSGYSAERIQLLAETGVIRSL
jgi:crotonobetainyl-CoA:carnitine CoA-transferase CaiB-like acyl-CoA transferase